MAPRRGRPSGTRQTSRETKRQDRAWRAVKAFNELKPTFTAFARAVTGNNSVTVELTDGGTKGFSKTDGVKRIMLQPPIALGDEIEHDRALCNQRDSETLVKMCKACAARELLVSRLFHEIAHIAFKSHGRIYKHERETVRSMIREWHPSEVCNHASGMLKAVDEARSHLSLTASFHPYLYQIIKSYEDARIDTKMYRARPGLKLPTEARMRYTFGKGVEIDGGEHIRWDEAPHEAQVMIGLLLLGMGYDIRPEYFSGDVIQQLEDQELIRISSAIGVANSVNNAFEISISAFNRLQEMGLCVVPKCEPAQPPPPSLNKDPDESDESNEDGGKGNKDENTGKGDGSGNSDKEEPNSDKSDDDHDDADPDGDAGSEPDDGNDSPPDQGDAGDDGGEPDPGDGGGSGSGDDAGEDREEAEAAPNSGGGGPGDEDTDTDSQPDDGEVPAEDDRPDASEQGRAGDQKPDDAADQGGHDDGRDADEPDAADEDTGADSGGDGSGGPGVPPSGDPEPGEGDDSAGTAGDDESDGEPGEDADDPDAGSDGDPGDVEADGSPDPSEGLADDPGAGGDDDLEDSPDDLEGSEARGPLGEEVWDEDNPETIPEPPADPEQIERLLEKFMGHDDEERIDAELLGEPEPGLNPAEDEADRRAVEAASSQVAVFDTSSRNVRGALDIEYPHQPFGWGVGYRRADPDEFMPTEATIGKSLMQARVVFSENKRAKTQDHLRSGKINGRVLGRRAALGDDRIFRRKILPGKRDYFVVISGDCSGSTNSGYRNERIKRAIFAQAELLNRLGIPFAVYGHTGGQGDPNVSVYHEHPNEDDKTELWMLQVKKANEPWNGETRKRLADMPPVAENLDGHTLEYLRKVAEKSTATDRIILYYTDGSMPAANYDEELEILKDEIDKCKRKSITLMAVGINTNSPEYYGFDTVQVDSDSDLSKVIDRLRERLTK